ncbi:MAG: dihydroorotate dehydrogenase electron transfer subunit [Calditrichota bacterium]
MNSPSEAQFEIAGVQSNRMISEGIWKMVAIAPRISALPRPGQFVHVRVSSGFKPFLRRPLSLGPCLDGKITLIYAVRGEGTRLLTTKVRGDPIDLIGPLGRGFDLPPPDLIPILVGGGIGVVPLLFFNYSLGCSGYPRQFLLGVRSAAFLNVNENDIARRRIKIASDDGSVGFKGNVIQLLEKTLDEKPDRQVMIFACGPNPMLAELKRLCLERNLEAQVSLEVPMGCGVGACQSCAVARADGSGYWLVCQDGPVFNIRDVLLDPGTGV